MTVRAYTEKDLDSMVKIWNQVVEDDGGIQCVRPALRGYLPILPYTVTQNP